MGTIMKIRIKVDKASLIAKLNAFSADLETGLTPAWQRIADTMHLDQISFAPLRTGNLISNIENDVHAMGVRSSSSAIDPRNGYNYARIQHDGGIATGNAYYPEHYITGKFYMTLPLGRSERYIEPELDAELKKIIIRCGLG